MNSFFNSRLLREKGIKERAERVELPDQYEFFFGVKQYCKKILKLNVFYSGVKLLLGVVKIRYFDITREPGKTCRDEEKYITEKVREYKHHCR